MTAREEILRKPAAVEIVLKAHRLLVKVEHPSFPGLEGSRIPRVEVSRRKPPAVEVGIGLRLAAGGER